MIGDSGYDDHKLYDLSIKEDLNCMSSIEVKNTPNNRLELIQFYESELGQAIYSWRSKSIEPLIEHIKCGMYARNLRTCMRNNYTTFCLSIW